MKLKKTLVMVLAACLLVGTLAGTAFAAPINPEIKVPEGQYVPGAVIGEFQIFDQGEFVFAGILTELDTPYTGWKMYGDNWAYYRNGELQRHWQLIDGNWYYFNNYGLMVQRGVAWIENRLYYFDENGVCDTTPGWKYVPNFFYVYENVNVSLVYPAQGYSWFYLNQNGYIQTGWNYIDGTWHMCDKQTGRMLCNEWYIGEGGYIYYFDQYTDMATGWMTVRDELLTDRTYYFNASGVQQYGWLNVDGNWYYLVPNGGYRVENSWAFIQTRAGKYWYLFDEDGVMQTGWQEVLTGNEVVIGKDAEGKDIKVPESKWYYLASWGAMMKGEQYINGTWYDFGDDGVLAFVYDGTTWKNFTETQYQASWYLVPGESDKEKSPVPGVIEF